MPMDFKLMLRFDLRL